MNAVRLLFASLAIVVAGSGCLPTRQASRTPDQEFGHRVEGRDDEGRETLVIVPASDGTDYIVSPAVYESVTVRPAAPVAGQVGVAIELLVKGAFPDACTELHEARQQRSGNLVQVELDMRRPRGALCATVLRPYRFYLTLDGLYEPGPYSLTVNGRSHPFEIRDPGA